MKYRTKLYFAFIATAVAVSYSVSLLVYYNMKPRVFKNLQVKATTVAATTAALLDVQQLKEIDEASDLATDAYEAVKKQLIKARDANRRKGIRVGYLYTFKPKLGGIPNDVIYLVDAEEDPENVSLPGDIDINSINVDIIDHLNEYYSPPEFVNDWGVWVSGFAPVFDEKGAYVATVGVDISSDRYFIYLQRLRVMILIGFASSFAIAMGFAGVIARRITGSLKSLMRSVHAIGEGNLNEKIELKSGDEFETLAAHINHMTEALRERERLKDNFARYVSKQVMEKIMGQEEETKLHGEERKITVLVSDIRGFTYLAESLPPENVVTLLNEYFEAMLEPILHHGGTLDKYIGDGMLVEFGAPFDDPNQEINAVQAAIDMQFALEALKKKWQSQGKPLLQMGIGVHTGVAIVGNIGTEKRLEYTAIGATVDIAVNLERATKLFQRPILISETTFHAVKDKIKTEDLGAFDVMENAIRMNVYSVENRLL